MHELSNYHNANTVNYAGEKNMPQKMILSDLRETIYAYGGPFYATCDLCARRRDPGCAEDEKKKLCRGFRLDRGARMIGHNAEISGQPRTR